MITFSINNSFDLLNKNKEYSTMLNLAQNYMNETKNDIKYKNDKINTETIYLNKFQINKIITKKENYYNQTHPVSSGQASEAKPAGSTQTDK